MAVQYINYQDNRKDGTKLFYGRAVHPQTRDLSYMQSALSITAP